ncbi:hypothetical protein GHT06_013932 [Daphnia sinensis]|uniref:E3 ubiquitin-protein ligase RNF180 n=1 Tax=Daphnia sinensis TaxID=1820382 RepID=A0AAD5LDI5_9CRUS|nr:hypothetical protein GHT06_013932 [Daphnia sinensis]
MSEFYVRCRKCRSKLIAPDEKDCITTCHGSGSSPRVGDEQCFIEKSILYLKDEQLPKWLETLVQNSSWTKGKIVCPSCDARLGTFDFLSGQKCQCQHYVLPSVRLTSSKVDMLNS